MIKQTLPFKLETTKDLITSHAGLALLGEFSIGLGLPKALNRELPKPGSGAGYLPSEYVLPLMLMLNGGGRRLEDIRQISDDHGLREVLEMKRMPSSDAAGDWLRRGGKTDGLAGLSRVNRRLLKRGLKWDGVAGYTLDIDATGIEAEKKMARMTYKGYKGYMPMVGHLAENGLVIGDEFREGNVPPASRNLEFIKYCKRQLPKGKQIKAFRAVSLRPTQCFFVSECWPIMSGDCLSSRHCRLPGIGVRCKRCAGCYMRRREKLFFMPELCG